MGFAGCNMDSVCTGRRLRAQELVLSDLRFTDPVSKSSHHQEPSSKP